MVVSDNIAQEQAFLSSPSQPRQSIETHRHRKDKSLIGFDPLLNLPSYELPPNASHHTEVSSPVPADEAREGESITSASRLELSKELQKIATTIEHTSIRSGSPVQSPKRRQGRKLLSVLSPKRKPWSIVGHRKSRSFASASNTFAELCNSRSPRSKPAANTSSTPLAGPQDTLSPSMMQDLWELQTESAKDSLFVPSLAKPRPTSFLTGSELIRTSEQEATEWQLGIPTKDEVFVSVKVCQFLETYHKEECVLDLKTLVGLKKLDLEGIVAGRSNSVADIHRPIVEKLLDCATDLVGVEGFWVSESPDGNPDNSRQVLVLERQRQILCVYRGTFAEQAGKGSNKQVSVTELKESGGVEVFTDRFAALQELESTVFVTLDKLSEENPFCDMVFAGHSFGAAIATLAAYRYCFARPELRVAAIVSASPKVGATRLFRLSAHSLPNLKIFRLELGNARTHEKSGRHVGHVIRINPAVGSSLTNQKFVMNPVVVFKFGQHQEPTLMRPMLFKKDRDVSDFVNALYELDGYKEENAWVKCFASETGSGILGIDSECREMS